MADEMISNLREIENRIKDAEIYVKDINSLGLGKYELVDGSRFPEYVEFAKANSAANSANRKITLPALEISDDIPLGKIREYLLNQVKEYLKEDTANSYVQQVKIKHHKEK